MWTKEKIDKFISSNGFKPKKTKREIKELPNILKRLFKFYFLTIHNKQVSRYSALGAIP